MPESVQANVFNVKSIVFSVITEDTKTSYKYKAIKTFGAPMQVQFTPRFASGPLYGGGQMTENLNMLIGGTLKVEVNKVPIEIRAEIMNHLYTDGVLTEKHGDRPVEIAIGYELDETEDNRELVWLYNCKATPFGKNVQQKTENITYATDTIDFNVLPRKLDGHIRAYGDTANSTFTTTMADEFLETIPGGTVAA